MKVTNIRCFTNTMIPLNLRDTLYHAFEFCDYTSKGEDIFQGRLYEIYNAENKNTLDKILFKAKFRRQEKNALVYSMMDEWNNKEYVKVYIA